MTDDAGRSTPESPVPRVAVSCVDHGITLRLEQRDEAELRRAIVEFLELHGDCRTAIDLSGAPGLRLR